LQYFLKSPTNAIYKGITGFYSNFRFYEKCSISRQKAFFCAECVKKMLEGRVGRLDFCAVFFNEK